MRKLGRIGEKIKEDHWKRLNAIAMVQHMNFATYRLNPTRGQSSENNLKRKKLKKQVFFLLIKGKQWPLPIKPLAGDRRRTYLLVLVTNERILTNIFGARPLRF